MKPKVLNVNKKNTRDSQMTTIIGGIDKSKY